MPDTAELDGGDPETEIVVTEKHLNDTLIDAIARVQNLLSAERDTQKIDLLEEVLDTLVRYAAGEVPIEPSTATIRARRHAGQKRRHRKLIAMVDALPEEIKVRRGMPQPASTAAWPPPVYFREAFAHAEFESIVDGLRLSDRESLIAELISYAYKIREIAAILEMKPKTVSAAAIRMLARVALIIEAA